MEAYLKENEFTAEDRRSPEVKPNTLGEQWSSIHFHCTYFEL